MFKPDQKSIGQFIYQQRKLCGFTQQKLVDLMQETGVEISRPTLERTEKGQRYPSLDELLGICYHMGLTPNEVITGGDSSEGAFDKIVENQPDDDGDNGLLEILVCCQLMSKRSRSLLLEFARGRVAWDNPGEDVQEKLALAAQKAAFAQLLAAFPDE